MKGFECYTWNAILAPAGTPQPIVERAEPARSTRRWRIPRCSSAWRRRASIRRRAHAQADRRIHQGGAREMGADHQGVGRTSELKGAEFHGARRRIFLVGPRALRNASIPSRRADRARSQCRRNAMPISRRTLLTTLAAAPLASLLPRPAFAAYPDKPIRLIVPFAAGGNADLVARHRRRGHVAVARPADRRRNARRRGRQPRRRCGRDRAARRLHAAHRLERPADRQSVRAGQAQLRSAQGFRRHRARQPRAALRSCCTTRCRRRTWPS